MKKEVVLAIVIGFAIGLLITFGIYTARTALETAQETEPDSSLVTPEATSSAKLTIETPPPNALSDTDTITLKGRSSPEAIVTIITESGQQIITADKDGTFQTEIELIGGINEIQISAFTAEGDKSSTELTVVYSTADI